MDLHLQPPPSSRGARAGACPTPIDQRLQGCACPARRQVANGAAQQGRQYQQLYDEKRKEPMAPIEPVAEHQTKQAKKVGEWGWVGGKRFPTKFETKFHNFKSSPSYPPPPILTPKHLHSSQQPQASSSAVGRPAAQRPAPASLLATSLPRPARRAAQAACSAALAACTAAPAACRCVDARAPPALRR